MAKIDFLGKGWKYKIENPIYVKDEKIACSEDEECIRESIMIILGTAKGERVMRPDFGCGIQELVFAPNNTTTATLITTHIKEALLKWEPRVEVLDVSAYPDEDETNKLNINVEYRIKTSNTKNNLVYPFYLESLGK